MYNLNFDIWKFGHPQCANSANEVLSKLTIGDSETPAILELGMTEGNFSNAGLGTGGAIILASWIEHK